MMIQNENADTGSLEVRLLGPLSADVSDASVVPTASKPRQLLALMAFNVNRVLPVSTLMEEIWGDDAPRSAMTTLQTYILQLRRMLSAAFGESSTTVAKDVLVTKHGGYVLQMSPGSVDVTRYRELLDLARSREVSGDDRGAARSYDDALALWNGPALVDVGCGPVLELERARIEESRLAALEERADVWLRLGHHTRLLSELTHLIAQHPFNERLHGQCMTALYRAGRQRHALQVYAQLRRRLVDELGVEPSRQTRLLHTAILAADPALDLDHQQGMALLAPTG